MRRPKRYVIPTRDKTLALEPENATANGSGWLSVAGAMEFVPLPAAVGWGWHLVTSGKSDDRKPSIGMDG
jgi:hypothetical protein